MSYQLTTEKTQTTLLEWYDSFQSHDPDDILFGEWTEDIVVGSIGSNGDDIDEDDMTAVGTATLREWFDSGVLPETARRRIRQRKAGTVVAPHDSSNTGNTVHETDVQEKTTIRLKEIQLVHRMNVKEFIKGLNGSFFSVVFIKKDGTLREMNCRNGVRKHLKGGTNNVVSPDRPYLTVYDLIKQGYRTINLSTVQTVKANNKVYSVIG